MVVQHNISAMNANRYYGINNKALAGSLEKLSSGYAINRAGDNAAGLAVSEKMRAQIGGLTQASKNAEDGISMVQTFEGALQETDSILQRMRSLAVQSANGSYQDDVDREAMQLEFDQLNDELNQIADTDFNGVVMLNGGQMADGTRAQANGEIDYATRKTDVKNILTESLQADREAANVKYLEAKKAYESSPYDLSAKGEAGAGTTAAEWNTVDNSKYDKTAADGLWKDLGITDTNGNADTTKADRVDITFTKQSDGSWKATSGTKYLNGESQGSVSADGLGTLTATPSSNPAGGAQPATDGTAATGLGGFSVTSTTASGTDALGNAIFDGSQAEVGSTVTLTYSNAANSTIAPTNIGMNESSLKSTVVDTADTPTVNADGITFENKIENDSKMTKDIDDAYTALEDAAIEINYNTGDTAGKSITVGGQAIDLSNTDGEAINLNGTQVWVTADAEDATKLTFSTVTAKGEKGTDFLEIGGIAADTETAEGKISFNISADKHSYADNSATIKITAGDDPNLESSGDLRTKLDDAKKALADADARLKEYSGLDENNAKDWEKIKTAFAESQSSSGSDVSYADAFDQSRTTLTYAKDMNLQVGARTKDEVNFTFSYSSNGLGDLKSNLNCSARTDGLGTAELSLKTAKDANAAIDKIDNAINKVNMVRATFGSVQNRLEHKINNIDTNTENLTAAESRIRDTQMDKEMMKFTSAQILSQASQSMLAQANSLPQGVLQLLG